MAEASERGEAQSESLSEQAARNTLALNPLVGVSGRDLMESASILLKAVVNEPTVAAGQWLSFIGELGSIGTGRVARARPDGYTIDIGYLGNHVLSGAFYSLQYDLNDFAPISLLVTGPYVLFARKTMAAKDLSELIAWLKANKASAGISAVDFRL